MRAICKNCGHTGEAERKLKGHFLITLLLILCYIVPGIIYMIWRRTGLKDSCEKCGSTAIVPADSSGGIAARFEMPSPDTHVRCPDCREFVLMDARKCKHCGSTIVPTVQMIPTVATIPPSGAELLGREIGRAIRRIVK